MPPRQALRFHGTQRDSKNSFLSLFAPPDNARASLGIEIQRASQLGSQGLSLRLDPPSLNRLIQTLRLALEDAPAPPGLEKSSTDASSIEPRWTLLLQPDLNSDAASARCLGIFEGSPSFWRADQILVFRLAKESGPFLAIAITSVSWLTVSNIALALDRAAVELLLEGARPFLETEDFDLKPPDTPLSPMMETTTRRKGERHDD